MLDPGRDAPGRDAVANEAKKQIEAGGTLKHENVWGLRKLAYEIAQRTEADYRWFRFEASTDLLEQLDHNLKIADGVLRFRIFKVDADTPVTVPPPTAAPGPGASRERPSAAAPPAAPPAEPEVAAEGAEPAAATTVAEPPAEVEAPSEPAAEAEPAAEPEGEAPASEPEAAAPEAPEPSAEDGGDGEPAEQSE